MKLANAENADGIKVSEHYDKESDIYYLTVLTGEPSIVAGEFDDTIIVELGMFTRMPTGYRIMNYSKVAKKANAFQSRFIALCKSLGLKKLKGVEAGNRELAKILQSVPA